MRMAWFLFGPKCRVWCLFGGAQSIKHKPPVKTQDLCKFSIVGIVCWHGQQTCAPQTSLTFSNHDYMLSGYVTKVEQWILKVAMICASPSNASNNISQTKYTIGKFMNWLFSWLIIDALHSRKTSISFCFSWPLGSVCPRFLAAIYPIKKQNAWIHACMHGWMDVGT